MEGFPKSGHIIGLLMETPGLYLDEIKLKNKEGECLDLPFVESYRETDTPGRRYCRSRDNGVQNLEGYSWLSIAISTRFFGLDR